MKIRRQSPFDLSGAEAPRSIASLSSGTPPILDVLGSDGMVRVTGVKREGGRIVWFNWLLAEELGLDIPKDRRMTLELEKELLDALSFEVLPKGVDPAGRRTIDMYADRYGGRGLGHNRGSGRAAFFGELNIDAKGIGAIEELLSQLTSFGHRHGGMTIAEGGLESIWGEVNTNLFRRGSTRILAILDRGDYVVWEGGTTVERRGVDFRLGDQTRPGHLFVPEIKDESLSQVVRMLEQSEDLVWTDDGQQIDLSRSLERWIEAHARTAAEQYRHRVLHGALSPSNCEVDGAMLDLATETTQPRTAPIRVLDRGANNSKYTFGTEYESRIDHFETIYQLVDEALVKKPKLNGLCKLVPFSVRKVFEAAYARERTLLLAEATGIPPSLAREVVLRHGDLASRFASVAVSLADEVNPTNDLNVDMKTVDGVSVVDLFGALGRLPRAYFLEPSEDVEPKLRELLAVTGGDQPGQRERIDRLVHELAVAYVSLLTSARAIHVERGGDPLAFERAVTERAEFENRPTGGLFRAQLRWDLGKMVDAYSKSGDADAFQRGIDRIIAQSLRSVDALKTLGASYALDDGTHVIEERTIRGVTYGVHLPPPSQGDLPAVIATLPLERSQDGRFTLPSLGGATLDREQLESLRFRYTLDGWATKGSADAAVGENEVTFRIPSFPSQAATIEGLFHVTRGNFWIKDRASNFEGYVFAVPAEGEEP